MPIEMVSIDATNRLFWRSSSALSRRIDQLQALSLAAIMQMRLECRDAGRLEKDTVTIYPHILCIGRNVEIFVVADVLRNLDVLWNIALRIQLHAQCYIRRRIRSVGMQMQVEHD